MLQYIYKGEMLDTRRAMFTRLNRHREDHLWQLRELADLANTYYNYVSVDGTKFTVNDRGLGRGSVRTIANAATPKCQQRCYKRERLATSNRIQDMAGAFTRRACAEHSERLPDSRQKRKVWFFIH